MDIGIIALLCFLGYLAALVLYAYVCHLKSEEKIKYGDDKIKLQKIVANAVQTGEFYVVAYAYWYDYKKMHRGKDHAIAYWYYGIGFNEERIYVVTLQFEKGKICCEGSFCIDKASVGKVESNISEKKIRLFDKNGQELVHLQVEDKNNSSHGNGDINLEQKAEAKAFEEWVVRWTSEINQVDTNKPNNTNDSYKMKNKNMTKSNTLQTSEVFLSVKDMERCLLQQAKFYDRGLRLL